jgi:hypothetical protein
MMSPTQKPGTRSAFSRPQEQRRYENRPPALYVYPKRSMPTGRIRRGRFWRAVCAHDEHASQWNRGRVVFQIAAIPEAPEWALMGFGLT